MEGENSILSEEQEETKTVFQMEWDVFLSFRGEDTRDGFTDRLYTALRSIGIRVFMDKDGIRQGDEIKQTLIDAIKDCAAAIAVISPRYAESHWCLEELALLCKLGKLVLPVFYRVEPSAVRWQKPPFAADMEKHERRFGVESENVKSWRNAMVRVAGRSGSVYSHRFHSFN